MHFCIWRNLFDFNTYRNLLCVYTDNSYYDDIFWAFEGFLYFGFYTESVHSISLILNMSNIAPIHYLYNFSPPVIITKKCIDCFAWIVIFVTGVKYFCIQPFAVFLTFYLLNAVIDFHVYFNYNFIWYYQ